jgi:molybdopterin synthase sulfurtransferase
MTTCLLVACLASSVAATAEAPASAPAPPAPASPAPSAPSAMAPAQVTPPRPESIITPERLAGTSGVLVFHVGWNEAGDYRRAHIPGAIYFDTGRIERPPLWRLIPDAELERALVALGVTRTTPVVLYGAPTMAATRVGLALLYAGVDDVRILDGGIAAWRASGRPVESGEKKPRPAAAFGGPVPGRPGLIVHARQVKDMLDDPGAVVVSVRSLAEQTGKTSGYRDLAARGRIRGDVWGGGGSDANHMEDFENPDGTLKGPEVAAARWARAGILPEKRVAFYCGTGWRASLAFWNAWTLGWPRISVYDPGWYEWSRDPANPNATLDMTRTGS